MLGYTWEEMSRLAAEQVMHPDDQVGFSQDLQSLIERKGDIFTSELRYRHHNGTWVWARVAVSLVTDDDGAPLHFIGHAESLEAWRRVM